MHVPIRAAYPTLTLIEAITGLFNLKQEETESILGYLERFKSEINVVSSLFGDKVLDRYMERQQDYINLSETNDAPKIAQAKYKKKELD